MKRTAIITAFMLIFTVSAAAVVGGPEPGEGEMAITSSGSGASVGASENGTEWTAKVSQVSTSCASGDNRLENVTYSGEESIDGARAVSFTGYVQTPNPCHTVDHEISKEKDGVYTIDIQTEGSLGEDEGCIDCVGMVKYQAEFQREEGGFKLHVEHDGDSIETLEYGYEESNEEENSDNKTLLDSLFSWLKGLF